MSDAAASPNYPRLSYGVVMAVCCAFLWAVLAPVLELALSHFSPLYIVWFRFSFSFVFLFLILSIRQRNPLAVLLRPPPPALIAALLLLANYCGFMKGVQLGGSITAQVLIQFGNIGLIAIGVFYFHERITRLQIWGLCLVFLGMGTFIAQKGSGQFSDFSAVLYLLFAAAVWSIYAAVQKSVSRTMSPQSINLIVFLVSGLLLSFFIDPAEISSAPLRPLLALIFCGLNTLVAYGALAEALKNAPVSIVSPIITLNPLGTVVLVSILTPLQLPWLRHEQLSLLAYAAGFSAVTGVAIVVSNRR